MTQVNLSMKQKHSLLQRRLVVANGKAWWRREGLGVWG